MFALCRMPAPVYINTAASRGPGAAQTPPSVATGRNARKKAAAKGEAPKASTSNRIDRSSQIFDAVAQEKERVVRRLLGSGTDPNLRNANGETLLMLACAVRDPDTRGSILGCLTKHAADVNAQDRTGQTALMRAVVLDRPEAAVAILLNAGCDLEIEDCDGNNALCHAAVKGRTETVRKLVTEFKRRDLDVDKCNMRGLTPLLIACQRGHLESARTLVEVGGASPSIRDLDNFMTAADWMRLSGQCSSPEMAFLSTSSRRKRCHGHSRLSRSCAASTSIPLNKSGSLPLNWARRAPRERVDDWKRFPQIDTSPQRLQSEASPTSDLPEVLSSHDSRSSFMCRSRPKEMRAQPSSMFTLPLPSPQIKTHSTLALTSMAPSLENVPFTKSFKSDLYSSAYLTRRKGYVHSNRNHKSKFYSQGALAPLAGSSQDGSKPSEQTVESSTSANATLTRHCKLPPLKSRNSNTE